MTGQSQVLDATPGECPPVVKHEPNSTSMYDACEQIAGIYETRLGSSLGLSASWEMALDIVTVLPPCSSSDSKHLLLGSFCDEGLPLWHRLLCGGVCMRHFQSETKPCEDFDVLSSLVQYKQNASKDTAILIALYVMAMLQKPSRAFDVECSDFIDSRCRSVATTASKFSVDDGNNDQAFEITILSTLYSQGGKLANGGLLVLSKLAAKWSPTLLASLQLCNCKARDFLVKALVAPMFDLLYDSNTASFDVAACAWEYIDSVYLGGAADFLSSSTLLCLVLERDRPEVFDKVIGFQSFWPFVQSLFLDSDMVVRKRGAYIMQCVLTRSSSNEKNSRSGKRSWMHDYLDVYHQVEDCHALHLVKQITEHMQHLCHLAYTASTQHLLEGVGQQDKHGIYPNANFKWLKALIHVILRSQMPNIRKEITYRVLEGAIVLDYSDETVLQWISDEFLPSIDSVVFFPSAIFFGLERDLGCENALSRPPPVFPLGGNVFHTSPGAIFPYFISRVLLSINSSSRKLFVRALVTACTSSMIKTLSTMKWIFRAFSEPSVLSLTPNDCFVVEDLHLVQSFYQRKLISANSLIREQITSGLHALILQGIDMNTVAAHEVIWFLHETVTLPKVLSSQEMRPSFLAAMGRSRVETIGAGDVDSKLAMEAMAYSILATADEGKSNLILTMIKSHISDVQLECRDAGVSEDVLESVRIVHGLVSAIRLTGESNIPSQSEIRLRLRTLYDSFKDKVSGITSVLCDLLERILNNELSEIDFMSCEISSFAMSVSSVIASCIAISHSEGDCVPEAGCKAVVCLVSLLNSVLEREAKSEDVFRILLSVQLSRIIASGINVQQLTESVSTKLVEAVFSMGVVLLKRPNILSTEYRIAQSSVGETIFAQFIGTYNVFSKFNASYIENRWAGISSVLELWAKCHHMKGPLEETVGSQYLLGHLVDDAETITIDGLSGLLSCTKVVMHQLLPFKDSNAQSMCLSQLSDLLEFTYDVCCKSSSNINISSISTFIQLVFSPSIMMHSAETSLVGDYYHKLYKLGIEGRPHILQMMVIQLTAYWFENPSMGITFAAEMVEMLLYKEPPRDDNAAVNTTAIDSSVVIRFLVLGFCERLQQEKCKESLSLMQTLIRLLIFRCAEKKYSTAAMLGSPLYFQKLRIWQTLCCLSHSVDLSLFEEIVDAFFVVLFQTCAHGIRTCIEIFGAKMAIMHPTVMLPRIIKHLAQHNHTQQNLSTLFIILGYIVEQHIYLLDQEARQSIVDIVLPWMACAAGLPRTIALMLLNRLLPDLCERDNCSRALCGMLTHMHNNKDTQKILKRGQQFFRDNNVEEKCTVAGLRSMGSDNTGEIVPDHLLHVMSEVLKSISVDSETVTEPVAEELSGCAFETSETLQTKIVPFDALQLALAEVNLSRARNGQGRQRSSVVVVSSLVEKVQNIAGIARSCEIFAVEELLVPDLSQTKSDTFQGIAVSAGDWLPMSECKPEDLVAYLLQMKRKGYDIVALEQTDSSITLGDVNSHLPEKCVLVLGREKEGVPVEVLQICTCTVEIQQFGVIRSLNVHVATSILIYELTKKGRNCM